MDSFQVPSQMECASARGSTPASPTIKTTTAARSGILRLVSIFHVSLVETTATEWQCWSREGRLINTTARTRPLSITRAKQRQDTGHKKCLCPVLKMGCISIQIHTKKHTCIYT